jgi:hypothetical protein
MLGVLLVENEPLDSRAVSSAGARGLMQVDPVWRPVLGPRSGFDLAADSGRRRCTRTRVAAATRAAAAPRATAPAGRGA